MLEDLVERMAKLHYEETRANSQLEEMRSLTGLGGLSIGHPCYLIPDVYERDEVEAENRAQLEKLKVTVKNLTDKKERLRGHIKDTMEKLQVGKLIIRCM